MYQKSIRGGVWVIVGHNFNRFLDLIRAVVLARLLLPRDFGQMAIAVLSVSILDTFTQVGIRQAMIQKQEQIEEDLDTGWTLGIIRGVLICLCLFLLAPWIASFFDGSPRLTYEDILKPNEIVLRIRQKIDPRMDYLWNQVSEESRIQFLQRDLASPFTEPEKTQLQEVLNTVVFSDYLGETEAFSSMELTKTARQIVSQKIREGDIPRANRVFLEEMFSDGKCIRPMIVDIRLVAGIIRSLGFIFFLSSLVNIGVLYLSRDLEFNKQFIFESVSALAGTIATIAAALLYRSVWALIIGRLASVLVQCVHSYIIHPYRPRWRIDWEKARAMWNFGQHILWSTILKFLVLQGDDLFLAKMLGLRTLGLYRYAYQFSSLVATEAGVLINKVAFPVFSRLQENLEKIKSGYEKSIRYVVFLAYPFSGGLIILARETVLTILGPEWLEMVSAFQILCILGFCKGMQGGNVFMAMGRPGIITRLYVLRLILMVVSIYPLTRFMGMPGTALSVTASALLVMPVHLYFVQQCIGHTLWEYVKTVFAPLAATGIMMGLLIVLKSLIPWSGLPGLVVLAFSSVFLYGASLYLFSRIFREYDPRELYLNIRKGWSD